MKKLLLLLLLFSFNKGFSQNVQISRDMGQTLDFLYPTCISIDEFDPFIYYLDTTCFEILNEDTLTLSEIAGGFYFKDDLRYFRNLRKLTIYGSGGYGPLFNNFYIPETVEYLELTWVGMSSLEDTLLYPSSLKELVIRKVPFPKGYLPDSVHSIYLSDIGNIDNWFNVPKYLKKLEIFQDWNIGGPYNFPDFSNVEHLEKVHISELYDDQIDGSFLSLLPDYVDEIYIYQSGIDTIHHLPAHLKKLTLMNDQIWQVDYFPEELQYLDIYGFFSCLPEYPQSLQYLEVESEVLSSNFCHPNFVPGLGIETDLCSIPGNNFANCPATTNALSGYVFHDMNPDCNFQMATDMQLFGIPVVLIDSANTLFLKTYTDENGLYAFNVPDGGYTIYIDTVETNFRKSCDNFKHVYGVSFDGTNNYTSLNFQLTCDTLLYNDLDSFDIQINSIISGAFRPDMTGRICIATSDLLYNAQLNLNCISGFQNSLDSNVQIGVKVFGAPLSLSTSNDPEIIQSESNDTLFFNYTETNYQTNYNFFCFYVNVDTTAQLEDFVCVEAQITPPLGDMIASNNYMYQCFEVVNSYDPNMKQTYPMEVLPGYEGEFRYTIHFQNTGTAPAINVQLVDTLDSKLDVNTFRVVESSHTVQPYLSNNRLIFKFNNINLADSLSDPEGSKGHVTYAIKPGSPMLLNEEISNTAHIFFDFNSAIVTNTTSNLCTTSFSSIEEIAIDKESILLYPNPVSKQDFIYISNLTTDESTVELYSLAGTKLTEQRLSIQDNRLDLPKMNPGVYVVRISTTNAVIGKKLIKM